MMGVGSFKNSIRWRGRKRLSLLLGFQSFPFDGCWWFAADVVTNSVDPFDFVDDA